VFADLARANSQGPTAAQGGDIGCFRHGQLSQSLENFAVLLGIDDPVDAERIFHALAENGTVQMPLQKTFWSVRFGVLVDQFGIPWAINCEQAPSVA